ncbi:MAG: hypothetical protein L6R19_09485 [Alphaproteobacteria bacterium]|nr:hypothetical protein [Alphaproteobacteria bacterium]
MTWRRYWTTTIAAAAVGLGLIYAAILVVDPFETVGLTPWFDRQPMGRDKRFALPALARHQRFDSAVIGSSTARLLRPGFLDQAFGASFVNLSLDGSLLAEHVRALAFFLAHHPRPKAVIVGMDPGSWCQEERQPGPRPRALPDLLYDDNRWNELPHLMSWSVLRQAGEQALYLAGLTGQRWGRDGYTLGPQGGRYDPVRAERLLYPLGRDVRLPNPIAPGGALPADRAAWRYGNLAAWGEQMLGSIPSATLTIVMFPPAHVVALSPPGSPADLRLAECKRRIAQMAACRPNAHVVDFAFDSDITRHDHNFWDSTHVTLEVAERVQAYLVEAVRRRAGRDDLFRYVDPADRSACGRRS